MTVTTTSRSATPTMARKPKGPLLAKGSHVFMPKTEASSMGTVRTIVMEVRNFMTLFRLLLMMEAKASRVPVRMLLWMEAISSACWYSTRTSSSTSRSSSSMSRW